MTRVTRSRQAASIIGQTNVKSPVKRTTTRVVRKNSAGKTRSNVKKVSSQDENAVPIVQINKISKAKGSKSKGLVLYAKKNEPVQSAVLGLKSPALRDRTNATNEHVKVDAVLKLSDKIPLGEDKKTNVKRTTRKAKKQSGLANALNKSIKKFSVILLRVQAEDYNKNSLQNNKDLSHNKKDSDDKSERKDINEKLDKSQQSSFNKSTFETPVSRKATKRKNLSLEDVEKLLNEDNDEVLEGHKSDDEETKSVHEKNAEKYNYKTKKFFKYKSIKEKIKPDVPAKKYPAQNKMSRAVKKMKSNDSTFSPKTEDQRRSNKLENKQLRTRIAKNYCETSRISNQKDEAKKDTDTPVEDDKKGVPIYKTIKLPQEEKKREPDQEYEFELSQNNDQKGKKRKKTVKKPAVKRAKKTTNQLFRFAPLLKKKPAKTVNKSVQSQANNINKANTNAVLSEKKTNNAINSKENSITDNIETDYVVPNDIPQIDDSAFQEAPTIKIISDQKLKGNKKYCLTTTPSGPRTAVLGLKVFAPKTNDLSQLNPQLNKMANHSLIRQSISPITKITDEFDAGSPWRAPIDTFTRVRRLVQSTPQVKRQIALQGKKSLEHIAELNKKSLGSEKTIHLPSAANKKPSKERSFDEMSTIKQDEPRKFGTVISNLSSSKSISTVGSNNNSTTQKSSPQDTSLQLIAPENNQQSPAKAISPPAADSNLPINYKKLVIDDPTISFDNKENISPKNTPKKKIVAPSPFRFEKIRTSKRLAAISSNSKSAGKVTKTQEPHAEAGPSWLDKPKATVMKQTNLNNFLNLDDMPESVNISTLHGIFDDACSTPVSGKKPKKFIEEANIENAFGFDNFDCDDTASVENVSAVKIATEADVKNSVKGKLFPKARIKSSVPLRISENTVKRTLLRNVAKKEVVQKVPKFLQKEEDSDSSGKYNEHINGPIVQYKELEQDKEKIIMNVISFSDTFDILSEKGEGLETKVPEEIPLFVDLEPAHFTQPARKSYNKRKRNLCFDVNNFDSSDDEEKHEKKKAKKKKHKESYLNKEEKKRMDDWVKNVNKTFDEIEHFDLVVE